MDSTTVLSAVAVVFVHVLFAMAMLNKGPELWWMALYIAVGLLYAAVYFLGLRDLRPPGLRRRLRNAAVALGAFISAFFFYRFAAGVPWWAAIAAWLGFAVAGYLLYDVVVLDPMEAAVRTRLPV